MEVKHFIKPITWLAGISTGWGNGYVAVPKGHRHYGKGYDDVDVDVHYGLTFSEDANALIGNENFSEVTKEFKDYWIFGFDTAHYGDDLAKWPEEKVMEETLRLKSQFE